MSVRVTKKFGVNETIFENKEGFLSTETVVLRRWMCYKIIRFYLLSLQCKFAGTESFCS